MDGDRSSYRGVQCKGKEADYGSRAEVSEMLGELVKAKKFSPNLDHWIFATTAPVDATLQRAAREISINRSAKGLFYIDVLGWEEILALMSDEPQLVAEFYPEPTDPLPKLIGALRALPSLETRLAGIIGRLSTTASGAVLGVATWETVAFDGDWGIGPALMGYPLGPSDATACPQLSEVASALNQLKIAYLVRLVGEPGAGKSIGAYQIDKALSAEGFEVVRLLDSRAGGIGLETLTRGCQCVYFIDDAHLLNRMSSSVWRAKLILNDW